MSYINENLKELELLGILDWHKKGIYGKGVSCAILENNLNSQIDMFKGKVKTMDVIDEKLQEVFYNKENYLNSHSQKEVDAGLEVAPEFIDNQDYIYCCPNGSYFEDGELRGNIIKTLQFIIDNKIDIVSCSTSVPNHPTIIKMIRKAKKNNTIFFNAIGNTGRNGSIDDAVNTDEFIDVGAVYYSDRRDEWGIYNYSTTNKKVETVMTVPNIHDAKNKNRDFYSAGTSFSTPYLALGMCRLVKSHLKSKGKNINQDKFLELIKEWSSDLGDEGFDEMYGYGLFKLRDIDTWDISKYKNINNKEEDNMKFKDVPRGHYSEKDIDFLSDIGIINGKGNGEFGFGEMIKREDNAVIVCRLYRKIMEEINKSK